MIQTLRLQLLPCTLLHFEALLHGNEALAQTLGIDVPENWTEYPEMVLVAYDKLRNDPSLMGWFFYLAIHQADNRLIGTASFKGRPTPEGVVEIAREEVLKVLPRDNLMLRPLASKPKVVLVVGVNGTGKTTSKCTTSTSSPTARLARRLRPATTRTPLTRTC